MSAAPKRLRRTRKSPGVLGDAWSVPALPSEEAAQEWLCREGLCVNDVTPGVHHIMQKTFARSQFPITTIALMDEASSAKVSEGEEKRSESVETRAWVSKLRAWMVGPTRSTPLVPHRITILNTMLFLWNEHRCGILVSVRAGRVVLFTPFANPRFRNAWTRFPLPPTDKDPSLERRKRSYQDMKTATTGKPDPWNVHPASWWLNGHMVCNATSEQIWGDAYLPQLKHMFSAAARQFGGNADFMINKRDAPIFRRNSHHRPHAIVDGVARIDPLLRFPEHLPVFSFFAHATESADILMPTVDDWEVATGAVFPAIKPSSSRQHISTRAPRPWKERAQTAIFRGSSTGPGVTVNTNQRLRLAALDAYWRRPEHGGRFKARGGEWLLDAGITRHNRRDRIVSPGEAMTFIRPGECPPLKPFLPMQDQMQAYKFVLYVEGHSAAARFGTLMWSGAVVLKVTSTVFARDLWFFPKLRLLDMGDPATWEAAHVIPVSSKLRNLEETLRWAEDHDAVCERVARNARAFAETHLTQAAITQYLASALRAVEITQPHHCMRRVTVGDGVAGEAPASSEGVSKGYDALNAVDKGRQRDTHVNARARKANNWVKSLVIRLATTLARVAQQVRVKTACDVIELLDQWRAGRLLEFAKKKAPAGTPAADLSVLDLASGKSGDILKWRSEGAVHYVGVDFSSESLKAAYARINGMRAPSKKASVVLVQHDLTSVFDPLAGQHGGLALHPWTPFHCVSMQFALHYMFRDAACCARLVALMARHTVPGGTACATVLDGAVVAHRILSSPAHVTSFGNRLFRVEWDAETRARLVRGEPFGCGIRFSLVDAVCGLTEYLVSADVLNAQMRHAFVPVLNKPFGELLRSRPGEEMGRDEWELVCLYRAYTWMRQPAVGPDTFRSREPGFLYAPPASLLQRRTHWVGPPGTGKAPACVRFMGESSVPEEYVTRVEIENLPDTRDPWDVGSPTFVEAVSGYVETARFPPGT